MDMLARINASVPVPEKTYVGPDGLRYCAKCGQRVETVKLYFGEMRKFRCICECGKKEIDAREAKQKEEEQERNRSRCFGMASMQNWTFDKDDNQNAKLSAAMRNYVKHFADFRKFGKGLLLYGPCGTGKTFYAACIANALIDIGYTVKMTNFSSLINTLQSKFDDRQDVIDSLCTYSLLIIDDLGAERNSEYMQEQVFNIIDARYRSGKPMIITTNLEGKDFKNPQDEGRARIYDRLMERCVPVEVSGYSRRKQELKDTFADMKNLLGL